MPTKAQAKGTRNSDRRSERVTLAVTPAELADLSLVAEADQTDESVLLRKQSLATVVARAKRIRDKASR